MSTGPVTFYELAVDGVPHVMRHRMLAADADVPSPLEPAPTGPEWLAVTLLMQRASAALPAGDRMYLALDGDRPCLVFDQASAARRVVTTDVPASDAPAGPLTRVSMPGPVAQTPVTVTTPGRGTVAPLGGGLVMVTVPQPPRPAPPARAPRKTHTSTADDVAFLREHLDDPTLTAALTALGVPDVDVTRAAVDTAGVWKRRQKLTPDEFTTIRVFSADVATPAGDRRVFCRVVTNRGEHLWLRFSADDPSTDPVTGKVRTSTGGSPRLPKATVAQVLRLLEFGSRSDAAGHDVRVATIDDGGTDWFAVYGDDEDGGATDAAAWLLPMSTLRIHRRALWELLSLDEPLVWAGPVDYLLPEYAGIACGADLDAGMDWRGYEPLIGPVDDDEELHHDAAGRYLDVWLPQLVNAYYCAPAGSGTVDGLEISVWMFSDREVHDLLVVRNPGTGAIGAAYISLV